MEAAANKIDKIHCNICGHQTKHLVLITREHTEQQQIDEGEDRTYISWFHTWNLLECCGCENVTLRRTTEFSEGFGEPDVAYYPPPVSRLLPDWRWKLPKEQLALLKEVYSALHADSRCLAAMGARTLIDMVILDKIGDVGTFEQKLDALESRGLVSTVNRDFLRAALDAGSAAAHRGHKSSATKVTHVMDIVENLLQTVYVLPSATEALRSTTPPRQRRGVGQQARPV